ncbi:MAG: lysylphosphatidylglycerol synthase transmembrane domain-containing protein [Bacteroidales bacterium]|nr:lysylphosphatidylglycerol synthase transmembrane domain-containing protein [Bacteroidales bacterium]MDD4001864.1 lysylphosphatidylglycerol synthase transmembrane domain-containing protein [Bacteroidales bacterium]MDD4528427.1 lysylphosphatidylglycerol synthase transmembrane domain-containing protein [Bacteroidales bacterium]MDD4829807.1 lysylphosphatidylglycerol synthase transmembrane domain-containing protein [Bacteroidales bacterium]
MKRAIRLVIFLTIGLGFIWWFVSKLTSEELNQLFVSLSEANYFWFTLAILINIFSSYIRALRWQQLINPMGYYPKILPTFLAVMSGYLANLAIPRLGEILRCGLISKSQKIPFEKAVGTVLVERAVDTIIFLLIFLLGLMVEFSYIKDYLYNNFNQVISFQKIKYLIVIFIISVILAIFIIFILRKKIVETKLYKKIKHILLGFLEGIKSIFKLKNPLLFIFNSLFIWFIWILGAYVIFLCFPETMHLSFKIAFIATILGAIGPIVTPGGIGIFPAIIAETLLMYGIIKPVGYAAGWLLWIVSQIGILIFGLIGFIYFSKTKKKDETN